MPKSNKKRKNDNEEETEIVILAPEEKFKPFDVKAEAEEKRLSNLLFGHNLNLVKVDENDFRQPSTSTSNNFDSGLGEDSDEESEEELKPAWTDDEDDLLVGQALNRQGRRLPNGGINNKNNRYKDLLKHKFVSLVGEPKWATLKRKKEQSDSEDEEDEITQTCGFLKKIPHSSLPASTLEFKKLNDLNLETYAEGIINCIEFHPTSSVSLVAGHSGVATLYSVEGKTNRKLHNVAFQQFPIFCAKFVNQGNNALLGSRHNYIYDYDLISAQVLKTPLPNGLNQCKKFVTSPDEKYFAVTGKFGEVHILSTRSKEKVCTLKQNCTVASLSYNKNGNLLFGHSDVGEVTIWDMNMNRVRHKWVDEGCIQGSSITISPNDRYVATGSHQGVVNLYQMEKILNKTVPQPTKSVFNLTTSIKSLAFNSTNEMLVLTSDVLENSIRILHLESGTVFSNFPTFGSKLGNITDVNLSPGSGYLAIGNRKAVVSLFRLKYYKSY